jgi:hypothetical protein
VIILNVKGIFHQQEVDKCKDWWNIPSQKVITLIIDGICHYMGLVWCGLLGF